MLVLSGVSSTAYLCVLGLSCHCWTSLTLLLFFAGYSEYNACYLLERPQQLLFAIYYYSEWHSIASRELHNVVLYRSILIPVVLLWLHDPEFYFVHSSR